MRICIIGNSHVASLKIAWENGLSEKYPDVQLVFFASLTANIEALVAIDQSLTSGNSKTKEDFKKTSNGLENINLSSFSYCMLHGLSPRIRAYLSLVVKSKDCFYSRNALNRANPLHQSSAFKVLNEIRKISTIPVIFSPKPNALNAPEKDNFKRSIYKEVCHFINSAHDQINAIYIPQPASTFHCTYFTRSEYGKEAQNRTRTESDTAQYKTDMVHMNESFGEKHLEKILRFVLNGIDEVN